MISILAFQSETKPIRAYLFIDLLGYYYYYYYYHYYYLIAHLSNSVMMGLDVGFVLKNYTWVSLSN